MAVVAAHHDVLSPAQRLRANRAGLWLFFFSESIIFGLLLSSRFYLEGLHREHVDQLLGLVITIILLVSSVSAFTAETAMEHGRRTLSQWSLFVTLLLGIVFTVGVGYEWATAEFSRRNAFGTVFFTMTGMHAAHVVSGIVILFLLWIGILRGRFSGSSHWGLSAGVMYWHFVDVVWVFFYPALYLTK